MPPNQSQLMVVTCRFLLLGLHHKAIVGLRSLITWFSIDPLEKATRRRLRGQYLMKLAPMSQSSQTALLVAFILRQFAVCFQTDCKT